MVVPAQFKFNNTISNNNVAIDDALISAFSDTILPALLTAFQNILSQAAPPVGTYVPTGAIIYFGAVTAPTGFLACDGSAQSRTGATANLFAVIGTTFGVGNGTTTFNLPNMGGVFVRGWISGQTIDPARVFGSTQQDAFQGHIHTASSSSSSSSSGTVGLPGTSLSGGSNILKNSGGSTNTNFNLSISTTTTTTTTITSDGDTGSHGTARIANETRPINIALLPCIAL